MYFLLILIHLIASAVLILVVLLQSGKAGDLASTFGGATSQTAFGSRGAATMLAKATTVSAIIFMMTSLGLAIYNSSTTGSTVMDSLPSAPVESTVPGAETAPAEPVEAPGGETSTPSQEPAPEGSPEGQ